MSWRKSWSRFAGATTCVAGTAIALLGFSTRGTSAFFSLGGLHEPVTAAARLSCGMVGGLTCAMGYVSYHAAGDAAWARPLRRAIGIWFVLDCAVSIVAAPLNLLVNLAFLALLLPPLVGPSDS